MSIAVRIRLSEDSAIAGLFNLLALERDDKAELLDELGINLVENNRIRFLDGVGPDGVRWVESIRAREQGGETMRDTGALLNSLTHAVTGDTVEFGTNIPYGSVLHFGAVIKARNGQYLKFQVGGRWAQVESVTIPARPFLGIDNEDEALVLDIIRSFLDVNKGKKR